jgi:hypothetical protein
MRLQSLLLLLAALPLAAADSDFNGKWDIKAATPRPRAWWLQVTGAGTPNVEAVWSAAPGGSVLKAGKAGIAGGVLEFVFDRPGTPGNPDRPPIRHVYKVQLVNGRIEGTQEAWTDNKPAPAVRFTGVRAPELKDEDDGSWKAGKTVRLIDGKTLNGWRQLDPGRPGWYVEGGLMKNKQGASDIASDAKFWNFELKAEFRYEKGSNSGIGVRGRYEIQIMDTYGRPPDGHSFGALYSRVPPSADAARPPGEWQEMVIRIVGKWVTVTLNGKKVIDHADTVGLTAMAFDADEALPGPIGLQGDHGLIEFRRLDVTELVRH